MGAAGGDDPDLSGPDGLLRYFPSDGAAPVWRDVMLALEAGHRDGAPPMPAGVDARTIRFADGVEQPRREVFVAGTAQSLIAPAPSLARRPRISNPVAGSVYALDPDIPPARQRLAVVVTGAAAGLTLRLDRAELGPATTPTPLLPEPGQHRLMLVGADGRVVDQVVFAVR